MAKEKELSAKQKKFCLEFRKNKGCATEAAIAAGYSVKSASSLGSQLLKNPKVLDYIDELRKDAQRKSIMGIIERQETLTSIARNSAAADADRNRAIDILNKMDGLYLVRVDVNVQCNIGAGLAERMMRHGR